MQWALMPVQNLLLLRSAYHFYHCFYVLDYLQDLQTFNAPARPDWLSVNVFWGCLTVRLSVYYQNCDHDVSKMD